MILSLTKTKQARRFGEKNGGHFDHTKQELKARRGLGEPAKSRSSISI